MSKRSVFSILAILGITLSMSSPGHSECLRVVRNWQVVEGVSTAINAVSAANRRNSAGSRIFSGTGAIAGAYDVVSEEDEIQLIRDARAQNDSELILAFEGLVNREMARKYPGRTATRAQLYWALDKASAQNAICSKWYGAMSFKQMASIIAYKISRLQE